MAIWGLRLTDGTTDVAATLWGEAAKRFYFSIEIGGESWMPPPAVGGGRVVAVLFAFQLRYWGRLELRMPLDGFQPFQCLSLRNSVF